MHRHNDIKDGKKRYDIILWDIDGTLLDFLWSERYALSECLTHYGLPAGDEIIARYSAINAGCWRRLERGEVDKAWVLRHRFEELFDGMAVEMPDIVVEMPDIAAFQERYQKNLGSVFRFRDHGGELLKKLQKEGFLQYVVTNGVEWTQRSKAALSGIRDSVQALFISDCIGYEKPHPAFFEACFDRIAEMTGHVPDKSRILIVGDSLTSDMKGGSLAGIACCYYQEGAEAVTGGTHGEENAAVPGCTGSQTRAGKKETGLRYIIEETGEEILVDYRIGNLWEVENILWQNPSTRN